LHISAVKAQAARRQPVNVGRFDLRMPVTAEIVVQVIHGNEQHVRLARLRYGE
jgi:hypothetical protein